MKYFYTLLCVFLITCNTSFSQNLDTYNFIRTSYAGFDIFSYATTTDASGNLYAAGRADDENNNYEHLFIAKYDANGVLDATFGTNGILLYDFGSAVRQRVRDIEIDANGKIILAGFVDMDIYSNHRNAFVMRLEQNGTLDSNFGTNGIITIDNGYKNDAFKIVIAADGKIFIGGTIKNSTVSQLAVLKLNENGTYDSTFNTNGISVTDPSTLDAPLANLYPDYSYINDLHILPNGKILALASTGYNILLARYTAQGDLDATYDGGDGVFVYNPPSANVEFYPSEFHVNNDESIYISATKQCVSCNPGSGSNTGRWIFKMNASGSYDNTFSGDGQYFISDFFAPSIAMTVSPTQEVYIAVRLFDFELRKLTSTGNIDTSFHGDGIWNPTEVYRRKMIPYELQLTDSNELIIMGRFSYPSSSTNIYFYTNLPEQNNVVLEIGEYIFNEAFTVYPNPTKDRFFIKTHNNTSFAIELYNNLGMRLLTKEISNVHNEVNLEQYPSGVYYLKVAGTNTTQTILKN